MTDVDREAAPNGVVRYDFGYKYGPPGRWVSGLAREFRDLCFHLLWLEEMNGVAGREIFEHGVMTGEDVVGGPASFEEYDAFRGNGGREEWLAQAGWPVAHAPAPPAVQVPPRRQSQIAQRNRPPG